MTDEQTAARMKGHIMNFSVGEQVIIRFGRLRGQKATIIKSQLGDGYRVKSEDGAIRCFSSKGLEGKATSRKTIS